MTSVSSSPYNDSETLPPLASTCQRIISYPTNQSKPVTTSPHYPNYLELINDTFYHFIDNFFSILFFAIAPYLLIALGILLPIIILRFIVLSELLVTPPAPVLVVSIFIIYFFLLLVAEIWLQSAFFYLVTHLEEKPGVGEILSHSYSKMWALCWLTALLFLVSLGGSLLMIIPGLILAILSIFAPFVLMFEEVGGLKALQISRLRLHHFFGALVLRLAFFALTIYVFYVIAGLFSNISSLKIVGDTLRIILDLTVPIIYFIFISRNYHAIRWLTIEQPTKITNFSQFTYVFLIIIPILLAILLFYLNSSTIITLFNRFISLPKIANGA